MPEHQEEQDGKYMNVWDAGVDPASEKSASLAASTGVESGASKRNCGEIMDRLSVAVHERICIKNIGDITV